MSAISSLVSGLMPTGDALRVARLRSEVAKRITVLPSDGPPVSTLEFLRGRGFSNMALDRFFRPFFGGVFFDQQLDVPHNFFEFVFAMFSRGHVAVPASGMRALPEQLAARLPRECIRLASPVERIESDDVVLEGGQRLHASSVVLATDATTAAGLSGDPTHSPGWGATTTLYYAAADPPHRGPVLVVDGTGAGPINHLAVLNNVAHTYAPQGSALVSANVVGLPQQDDEVLDETVRAQLSRWFACDVTGWRRLRVDRIHRALPRSTQWNHRPDAATIRLGPGLYRCGDYVTSPSIEGALISGRLAAEAVLADRERIMTDAR